MTGFWSIIIPEETTNLVTNPSIYNDTTGYTAVGGSIARDTDTLRRGISSLKITPASGTYDGVYYGTVSLTTGQSYTFSVDIKADSGNSYQIYFANTSGVKQGLGTYFTATGEWERQEVTWACDSTASYQLRCVKNNDANTDIFYIDGLQCENLAYATTYVDGDQDGCEWSGISHASTSERDGQSRTGGREYNLDDYGFYVDDMPGIGMPPMLHQTQDQPLLPGKILRGMKTQPRIFDLIANQIGTTHENLHSKRKDLLNAIKPDLVIEPQPFILRYTGANADIPVEIKVVYDSGYQFTKLDGFTERQLPLRFIAYEEPYFYEIGNDAVQLSTGTTLSNANGVVARIDGIWSSLDTGLTGSAYTIANGMDDGYIYVGGAFSNVGMPRIGRWDGSAWSAMGSGADDGNVWTVTVGANGDVYAGGTFTGMGGVSNTAYIAKWNGSAWSALGTGMDDSVFDLAIGTDGTLYATGAFHNAGGTGANHIASWDGSTWSALGTGIDDDGYALTIAPNGDLYVAGNFLNAGGSSAAAVAKWDGSTWSALGTGLTNGSSLGRSLYWSSDGKLYVGGDFDAGNGVTCNNIGAWNGATFTPLQTGVSRTSGTPWVYALLQHKNLIYAGGYFTHAGGLELPDKMAVWNGTSWAMMDINLPSDAEVWDFMIKGNDLYIVFSTNGTADISSNQTITNNGTRSAFPKIVFERSGGTSAKVIYVKNETTGATLYLNYDLIDGEKITVDLTPRNKRITSNQFGDVLFACLRPSDFADFFLLPGANSISVLVEEAGSPTITAYMQWRNTHWSADGVAP